MKALPRPRLALSLIWAFALVVIVVLGFSTSLVRQQQKNNGVTLVKGIARLSAERIFGAFQTADVTITLIATQVTSSLLRQNGLTSLEKSSIRKNLADEMKLHTRQIPAAAMMVIVDADGDLLATSDSPSPSATYNNQDFIELLKNRESTTLTISAAYRSSDTSRLIIMAAKPLRDRTNGAYLGFVGIAYDIEQQFNDFYSGIGLPEDSTVSLYDSANLMLTRFPQLETQIGKLPITPEVRDLITSNKDEDVVFAKSSVDQIDRVYAVRRVALFPVQTLVSLSSVSYMGFATLYTKAAIYGGIGVILLAAFLSHLAIRKREAEIFLRNERQARLDDYAEITSTVPGIVFSLRRSSDGLLSFPYISSRVVELMGVNQAALITTASPVLQTIYRDDLVKFENSLDESAKVLLDWKCEWRYKKASGILGWMEGHAQPKREPGGSTLWNGYFADVTDRVTAAENEAQHSALVKAAQDSLMAHVAVLDKNGVIISVNNGWRKFAENNQGVSGDNDCGVGIGLNYLEICQGAEGKCSLESQAVHEGITAVLRGDIPSFQIVYPCHSPTEQRWFQMMAAPLRTEKGGAVVSHTDITRMVLAESAMKESELHYRTLANAGSGLVWAAGLDKGCYFFSDTWLAFTGRTLEQERGDGWMEGLHPDDYASCVSTYNAAFALRQPFSMTYRLRHSSGVYRWLQDDGVPRFDTKGDFLGYLGSGLDITLMKDREMELRKLSIVVEQSPDSIFITDVHGNIEYVNSAFVDITGYSLIEVQGKNPRLWRSDKTPESIYKDLWETITQGNVWRGEFTNIHKNGLEINELATISPVREGDGTISHFLAIQRDITDKRRDEAQIIRLSFYDLLTGLANRPLLMEQLGRAMIASRRDGEQCALLIVNIDRFKTFNNARGLDVGDLLLIAVAKRLAEVVRRTDTLARMSGDEFAILFQDLTTQKDTAVRRALSVATKIQDLLKKPLDLQVGSIVGISASIGITLAPESLSDTALDVLRRADTALHRAKESGGNQTSFFETKMGEMAQQRFGIEHDLREGIPAGELRLFLQPQVNSAGDHVGAEALVRWQHPVRGLLSPAVFIPIAEESNLIVDLGVWVMEEVCELLAHEALADSPIRISVNISPRHFRQSNFVRWMRDLLASTGTSANRLTLEVTEGLVIDNVTDVIAKMSELASLGIHFSIDDFGTGYSSLSYLKRLPINELKIDKQFVQDAPHDPNDGVLVDAILSVAGHLQLKIVAEGVETLAQANFLNERAKVVHQGYLYGRPEPAAEWLRRKAFEANGSLIPGE